MNHFPLTDPDVADAARIYLAFVRDVEARLRAGQAVQTHWSARPYTTLDDWRHDMRRMIDRRINDRAGGLPRGRKWSREYDTMLRRDQRRIYDRILCRIRVYQFETPEARRRFSHLLSDYGKQ